MKKTLKPETTKPQYVVTTDITYAQVDSWFGHCRRDLKLDLIYPEDGEGKTYPCIVWICGGAWQRMDKAAHLAYLGTLAQEGFVVASVEYRTSNEGTHPMQLCDIKAAIRYLRAYAKRYRINSEKFGVMGESAGGYLTCMAALDQDKKLMWVSIWSIPVRYRQPVHGIHQQMRPVFHIMMWKRQPCLRSHS